MEKYNGIKLEYNINDNPNFLKSSLLGFQNILTAFIGIGSGITIIPDIF